MKKNLNVCPFCHIDLEYVDLQAPNKRFKKALVLTRGYHCESCGKIYHPEYLRGFYDALDIKRAQEIIEKQLYKIIKKPEDKK